MATLSQDNICSPETSAVYSWFLTDSTVVNAWKNTPPQGVIQAQGTSDNFLTQLWDIHMVPHCVPLYIIQSTSTHVYRLYYGDLLLCWVIFSFSNY